MRKYAWVVYKHKTSEQGPGRKEKERRRDRVMGPTLLCPTTMKLLLKINSLLAQEADLKRSIGSIYVATVSVLL